jgi:hypothetical protein
MTEFIRTPNPIVRSKDECTLGCLSHTTRTDVHSEKVFLFECVIIPLYYDALIFLSSIQFPISFSTYSTGIL